MSSVRFPSLTKEIRISTILPPSKGTASREVLVRPTRLHARRAPIPSCVICTSILVATEMQSYIVGPWTCSRFLSPNVFVERIAARTRVARTVTLAVTISPPNSAIVIAASKKAARMTQGGRGKGGGPRRDTPAIVAFGTCNQPPPIACSIHLARDRRLVVRREGRGVRQFVACSDLRHPVDALGKAKAAGKRKPADHQPQSRPIQHCGRPAVACVVATQP